MKLQYDEVYQNACALIIIYYYDSVDLLWSESVNNPSLSNRLSKFTSVPQTSTVLRRLAGGSWLCSKLDLWHIFLPLSTMAGKDEL